MQTQNNTQNLSRLKIDNIKPKWITCIWLFFFVIMAVLFLLVLAVPDSIFIYEYTTLGHCPSDVANSKYCTEVFNPNTSSASYNPEYALFVTGLSNKNQFAIIDLQPRKVSGTPLSFEVPINFNLTVYEVYNGFQVGTTPVLKEISHQIKASCRDTANLDCQNRTIAYINEIDHDGYLFVFRVNNADTIKGTIASFRSFITTVNPKYTDFLLALRYVCLAISICFAIYYWRSLRQMRGEKLVFEQKYIRVLGILLVFFNDPIYASTILKPNLASAVFSAIFVITFVYALLLFWIAAFQRIYRENTQVHSKALSLQKLVYIFFLWLFSVIAYCILSSKYLDDPSFDFNDEYNTAFTIFKVIMIVLLGVGLAWIFFGFAQILKKFNTLIWRHKIFFSFSCYFIFCYFIFMFTGAVNVYNLNGTKVMLVFGITNIYVWFLQVLYSPFGAGDQNNDKPMTLAEGLKEYQGYEVLDDLSNRDGGLMFDDNTHEEHSPDQIVFQIDNKGYLQQNYAPEGNGVSSNFDNFGNPTGNNQQFNLGLHQLGDNNSQEHKYPYEENHEDLGE